MTRRLLADWPDDHRDSGRLGLYRRPGQRPGERSLHPAARVEHRDLPGSGRAHVVGYLYNTSGTMDAANVLLRVDQLTPSGRGQPDPALSRVFGDVRARGRLAFDVPIASPAPTVRVVVESVDWVHECR